MQSVFNTVHTYNTNPQFLGNELGRNIHHNKIHTPYVVA